MERHARGGAADGGYGSYDMEYPYYLEEDYLNNYNCSPKDYYNLVLDEVESCRIDISQKNDSYKMFFGKFKGCYVHQISDVNYLNFICETQRNRNKKLVGQVLLRIDELYGH